MGHAVHYGPGDVRRRGWKDELSSSPSHCWSRGMWAAALPPGRNRLESRHGKTPPAPLHERAPRRPNRRSDALNWKRELKPSWESRSSRRGRGPGPRSRRSAPGKTPKKNGVRPRNSGSAETAAQRPSQNKPDAAFVPRSIVSVGSRRHSGGARTSGPDQPGTNGRPVAP